MDLKRKLLSQSGFTLVEMMMTLLIIGILVSIVFASYLFSATKARETACKSNIRIIKSAITQYQSQNQGALPPKLDSLVPDYIRDSRSLYCPESGLKYDYDNQTGEVTCPSCPP